MIQEMIYNHLIKTCTRVCYIPTQYLLERGTMNYKLLIYLLWMIVYVYFLSKIVNSV